MCELVTRGNFGSGAHLKCAKRVNSTFRDAWWAALLLVFLFFSPLGHGLYSCHRSPTRTRFLPANFKMARPEYRLDIHQNCRRGSSLKAPTLRWQALLGRPSCPLAFVAWQRARVQGKLHCTRVARASNANKVLSKMAAHSNCTKKKGGSHSKMATPFLLNEILPSSPPGPENDKKKTARILRTLGTKKSPKSTRKKQRQFQDVYK